MNHIFELVSVVSPTHEPHPRSHASCKTCNDVANGDRCRDGLGVREREVMVMVMKTVHLVHDHDYVCVCVRRV